MGVLLKEVWVIIYLYNILVNTYKHFYIFILKCCKLVQWFFCRLNEVFENYFDWQYFLRTLKLKGNIMDGALYCRCRIEIKLRFLSILWQ